MFYFRVIHCMFLFLFDNFFTSFFFSFFNLRHRSVVFALMRKYAERDKSSGRFRMQDGGHKKPAPSSFFLYRTREVCRHDTLAVDNLPLSNLSGDNGHLLLDFQIQFRKAKFLFRSPFGLIHPNPSIYDICVREIMCSGIVWRRYQEMIIQTHSSVN